ncbi:hypothetical protein AXK61_23450 [Tsukamurella pseudospumae]|uniref:Uncharacterized protein n=1 Tax=Tsukamurella pseudospumae TaxID=239498 RepID=A0A137ZD57_9ACTN|nr:hypothetical protein AXK61_23450 [Tsukamurella pseudospumae]
MCSPVYRVAILRGDTFFTAVASEEPDIGGPRQRRFRSDVIPPSARFHNLAGPLQNLSNATILKTLCWLHVDDDWAGISIKKEIRNVTPLGTVDLRHEKKGLRDDATDSFIEVRKHQIGEF